MKKVTVVLLSICLLFVMGFVIISSGFLKTEKDIIKYEGSIYSNITEVDWFEQEKDKYQKGERIGEIKRSSKSSLLLRDFSATKLSKGTVLYNTVDTKEEIKPPIILAETEDGGILYFRLVPPKD